MSIISQIPSPCYVLDEKRLLSNLSILSTIKEESGVKILLALKAFSMYNSFFHIRKYLDGAAVSSFYEAMLAHEYLNKSIHMYSPAYIENEFNRIIFLCSNLVFNSLDQWYFYKNKISNSGYNVSSGLRINPEYSEIQKDIYNPCCKNSRLGITIGNLRNKNIDGIDGFHFHALSENTSYTLERVIEVFEKKFSSMLKHMKWLNIGGGHLITDKDYDIKLLVQIINHLQKKYSLQVIMEPGTAVIRRVWLS